MKKTKPYLNYLCLLIFLIFSGYQAVGQFITSWRVTPSDLTITIPTTGSGYNYTVDWGDGTSDTNVTGNISHTYPVTGNTADSYSVTITGTFPRIYFNNDNTGNNLAQITNVNRWGPNLWTSMAHAFEGSNVQLITVVDSPNLANVTDLSFMFRECGNLNDTSSSMNSWDVTTITNMESLFEFANYRHPLSSWNVTNVTNMKRMFVGCVNFNRDLSNWNVLNVTDMSQMFLRASNFNTDISGWAVDNVTDMSQMFDRATAFNQNIGSWNVSAVTDMTNMFNGAGLSTVNYDALLTGWNNLPSLENGVNFDAGSSTYSCTTTTSRSNIINNNSWTISDGGISADTTPPTVVTKDITVQLSASNIISINVADIDDGSTDDCQIDLTTASLSKRFFDCNDLGTNTVTLSISDSSGNVGSATAVVTVEQNPLITVRAISQTTTILQLDANGQATITPQDVDGGSTSSGCGPVLTINNNTFDCTNLGVNSVILTATDGTVSDSDPALVIVEDNLAPTVVTQDIIVQLDGAGMVNITATNIDNGSVDNCTIATTVLDTTSFSCDDLGDNTVTLTVMDTEGNSASATATVTIVDNILPTAIAQNATIQLGASLQADIIATDVDNGSTDNCDFSLSISPSTFTCADLGVNTVTLTVTDASGNSSTATALVTVEQDPNQQLTAIAQDITVQLDANGLVTITPQDVDNGSGSGCSSTPTLSLDVTNFDCNDIGANTVTLTATEGANSDTATATVTVEDGLDPIVIAQDITVQLDINGQVTITPGDVDNGSSDNCGIASRLLDSTDYDCGDLGVNTGNNLIVIDTNGNMVFTSFTVTVEDNIVPTALTQNIAIQLDASGNASITAQQIDNGSTDNCSIASLSLDQTDFTCVDLGANTVTLTVTDASGNSSTATAVVTVEQDPNQQLTAIAQDIAVQLDANGQATITPQDVDNGSGSGCNSDPILGLDVTNFDCFDLGTYIVTLTASEGGITSTATAVVTIEDTLAPNILTQDISINLDANNTASITVADIDNGTTDNCTDTAAITFSLDATSFTCAELGDNTVTLTATDDNGNVSTATATVTVVDATAPTVVTQDITVTLDADGQANISASDVDNGSTDDCSGVDTLSLDVSDFNCPALGDTTVILTVTDASGNSATGTATVTFTATDNDNNGIADDCETRELVTPKGFSPNGDSVNDTWVIENIDDYPNNKVSVFNQWGVKVFEAESYNNDWNGTSTEGGGSKLLPAGAYLYVIETNDPDFAPQQGWVYLNY